MLWENRPQTVTPTSGTDESAIASTLLSGCRLSDPALTSRPETANPSCYGGFGSLWAGTNGAHERGWFARIPAPISPATGPTSSSSATGFSPSTALSVNPTVPQQPAGESRRPAR